MQRGSRAMSAAEREARRLERQQRLTHDAMTAMGAAFVAAGGAIVAGLAMATRAAISWESAWTSVVKVVDGSDEQLAALEDELRAMARSLPATHEEIAQVAAAAGQLGVRVEDIATFTRVMIDMGESTNLAAEDAAFALARLMNIMQTAPDDVSRLGAAIVELGNNSATTESEIVEMSLRIAGAGHTIGLSEAEVLAFATALSSVGIEAEAGGSAISRAFILIEQAVRRGGDRLDTFATVAGMTADQFVKAYRDDAAGAIDAFVRGLGRVQATGGDTFAVLESLGITEIRLRDAMLRLAGAGDLLSRSLEHGNRGWDENIALLEEAERRYGTTESRMQKAQGQLHDFAIDVGQTFLPVLGAASEVVGTLGDILAELPGPAKALIGVLGAVAGGGMLLTGSFLLAIPRIHQTREAMDQLAASGGRAALAVGALRGVTSFLGGPWGLAIGAAIAVTTAFGVAQANARRRIEEVRDTLDEQTSAITGNTRAWIARQLEDDGVIAKAQRLGIDLSTLTNAILGEGAALDYVNRVLDVHLSMQDDQARATRTNAEVQDLYRDRLIAAGVAQQDAERIASEHADALWEQQDIALAVGGAMRSLSDDVNAARESHERMREATEDVKQASRELTPEQELLARTFGLTAESAADLADNLDQLDKELKAVFDAVFGLQNAKDKLTEEFRKLEEQVKRATKENDKNAASLDGNSEAAINNRRAAQDLLETYGGLILKTLEHTGSQEEARKAVADFERQLDELEKQTGLNIRELEGYNDVAAEIERIIEVEFEVKGGPEAQRVARDVQSALRNVERNIRITFGVAPPSPYMSAPGSQPSWMRPGRHTGGLIHGVATGQDQVLVAATPGEFVVNRWSTERNRAALEAANAGARIAVVGSSSSGGQPTTVNYTYHITPRTADISVRDLELLMAQQEAHQRAGRAA